METSLNITLRSYIMLIPLVLFIACAVYVTYPVLSKQGIPGLYWDWETAPYSKDMINNFLSGLLEPWQPQSFGTTSFFIGYPARLLLITLLSLGLGVGFAYKFYIVLCLTLSGASMFYFLKSRVDVPVIPSMIGGIVYEIMPFMVVRMIPGLVYALFSYALTPLALSIFCDFLESKGLSKNLRKMLIASLAYSFASSQFQWWFLILPLVLGCYTLVYMFTSIGILQRGVILIKAITVFGLGVSFYLPWIFIDFFRVAPNLGNYSLAFGSKLWLEQQASQFSLLGSVTGQSYFQPFFDVAQEVTGNIWILAFISLLVMASISFLKRPNRYVVFSGIIILISWGALAGGSIPSLVNIWLMVYSALPALVTALGEIYNISQLMYLGFAILTAVGFQILLNTVGKLRTGPTGSRILRILIVLVAIMLVITTAFPQSYIIGKWSQSYQVPSDYREIYDILSRAGNYRVLWLPAGTVYGATYDGYRLGGPDPLLGYSPLPAQPQGGVPPITSYSTGLNSYLSFMYNTIYSTVEPTYANNISKLLSLGGFKFIVDRKDVRYSFLPDSQHQLSERFLTAQNTLASLPFSSATVYVSNTSVPILYAASADSGCIVTGGFISVALSDYLTKCDFFFFATQIDGYRLSQLPLKIVLFDGGMNDIVYSFIPAQYKIPVLAYASQRGWQPILFPGGILRSGTVLVSNPNGGILSTSVSDISMPVSVNESSAYYILANLYNSPSSNAVKFSIGNSSFTISTKTILPQWSWSLIGPFNLNKGDHMLTLSSLSSLEAVSLVAVFPDAVYQSALQSADSLLASHEVISINSSLTKLIDLSTLWHGSNKLGQWQYERGKLMGGTNGWSFIRYNLSKSVLFGNFFFNMSFTINDLGPGETNYIGVNLSEYSVYISIYNLTRGSLDIRSPSGVVAATGIDQNAMRGAHTLTVSKLGDIFLVLLDGQPILSANIRDFLVRNVGLDLYGNTTVRSFNLYAIKPLTYNSTTKITYSVENLSATHYIISGESSGPFFIIFLVNYDPGFAVEPQGSSKLGWLPVNGYGMAYYVDRPGSFRYEINYSLDTAFKVGWLIVFSEIIIFSISVVYYGTSKRHAIRDHLGKTLWI